MKQVTVAKTLKPVIMASLDKVKPTFIYINHTRYTITGGRIVEIWKLNQTPIRDVKTVFDFTIKCCK